MRTSSVQIESSCDSEVEELSEDATSSQVTSGADEIKTQDSNLQSYQLEKDKARRDIRLPARYAYAGLITYALMSAEKAGPLMNLKAF